MNDVVELALEDHAGRRVPAVQLVSEAQCPRHDRFERDGPVQVDRRGQHRGHDVLQPLQPVADLVVVRAVVQPVPALALVQIAEGGPTVRLVAHHQDGHRRGVDSRDRADALVLLCAVDGDAAAVERLLGGLHRVGEAFVERGVEDRTPLAAGVLRPLERCARRQDGRIGHPRHDVTRGRDVDENRFGGQQSLQRNGVRPRTHVLGRFGQCEFDGFRCHRRQIRCR